MSAFVTYQVVTVIRILFVLENVVQSSEAILNRQNSGWLSDVLSIDEELKKVKK
jgi:hypothetical protein